MVEGEPLLYVLCMFGFPCGASGKEPTCQCRRCKRRRFDPWVEKIHWRRKWQPTPVFLPGKSHGQRSLVGYSLKSFTEQDTTEATSSTCLQNSQLHMLGFSGDTDWEHFSSTPERHMWFLLLFMCSKVLWFTVSRQGRIQLPHSVRLLHEESCVTPFNLPG